MNNKDLINFFKEKRKDFPALNQKINNHQLIYADNAATTQKPKILIKALEDFYFTYNANIHRGIHTLSEKATEQFENTRKKIAKFIGSNNNEIIFTSGTTQAINSIVSSLAINFKEGDEIVLTDIEHHANLIPWQEIAKSKNMKIKFIPFDKNYRLDINKAKELITKKTALVAFPHVSNVLGTILPAEELIKIAKKNNALTLIDAAQSIGHIKYDVKKLDCDFLVFSAHKICGPFGVGVIYGKSTILEKMSPFSFGGNMIDSANYDITTYGKSPEKFEAGTANIADIIAFGKIIDYINEIGIENISKYENILTEEFLKKIKSVNNLELYGPQDENNRTPVFSFTIKNIHAHDLSYMLDQYGIAVRSGHHCVQPYHKKLCINSSSRVSLYFYNTLEEIDFIIEILKNLQQKFG